LPLITEPQWATADGWIGKETNLWLSGGGTTTSVHQDSTENLMVQLRGVKEFLLFAPDQKRHLYYEPVIEVSRDSRETGAVFVGPSGATSHSKLL
jgi:hypothetical protein